MAEKQDYDWEEVCLGGEFLEAVAREYYRFLVKDISARMCVAADENDQIRSRFAPPDYDWNNDPDRLLADFREPYYPGECLSLESLRESLSDVSRAVSEYARAGLKLSPNGAKELGKSLAMQQVGRDLADIPAKVKSIVRKARKWQPYYDVANSSIALI